jgi:hypothetical protein
MALLGVLLGLLKANLEPKKNKSTKRLNLLFYHLLGFMS